MALVMTASIRAIITTMRTHNYCNNGIDIRRGEQVMLNCGDDYGGYDEAFNGKSKLLLKTLSVVIMFK